MTVLCILGARMLLASERLGWRVILVGGVATVAGILLMTQPLAIFGAAHPSALACGRRRHLRRAFYVLAMSLVSRHVDGVMTSGRRVQSACSCPF